MSKAITDVLEGDDLAEVELFADYLREVRAGPKVIAADPAAQERLARWLARDLEARLTWLGLTGELANGWRRRVLTLGETR